MIALSFFLEGHTKRKCDARTLLFLRFLKETKVGPEMSGQIKALCFLSKVSLMLTKENVLLSPLILIFSLLFSF